VSAPDLGYIHRYEPATAPGAPTLLLLHGTGDDENGLIPLGRMLAPGAALLSPRGDVSERGAARFFRRLAEGVFDYDDVEVRAHALAAFLRAAADHYGFDANSVIAAGFSNGANIAGAMLLLEGPVFGAAALFRAQIVTRASGIVPRPSTLPGTPVFLAAGLTDQLIPPEETDKLATLLRGAGANVTLRWDPAGHTLTRGDIDAAREWLAGVAVRG
jgi:predicted esterase